MWLSMKHWSMTSNWTKRSAFGGFCVMEIPIWWCSNVLAIGMRRMQTWQVIDSLYISYLGFLKGASFSTSPELGMKHQIHCPNWDPLERRCQQESLWRTFTSH